MKKSKKIILIKYILIIIFFFTQRILFGSLNDSLIAYYTFNNNTLDANIQNLHGSNSNITFINDRFNAPQKAGYFNGTSSAVSIPNNPLMKPSLPITISIWFRIDYLHPTYSTPIFLNDNKSTGYAGVFIKLTPAGKINGGFGNGVGFGSGDRRTYTSYNSIAQNQWQHIVFVINNSSEIICYLNGVPLPGFIDGGTSLMGYSSSPSTIGFKTDPTNTYFSGAIDDLAIWKRTLSASEVLTVYNTNELIIPKLISSNPSCAYLNDGTIVANVSGGTPPYNYLWSNSQTTDSIYGLSPGTYSVTVTDINGKIGTSRVILSGYPQLNLTSTSNSSICVGSNKTILATASSGSGSGFSYHWNHGLPSVASHNITPTITTTYTVFATDSNNCSSDTSFIIITVNPLPNVSASGLNVAYCSNDNSAVALTGLPTGGSFSGSGVSGASFIPANSSLGNINVIYSYTSAQGCVGKDTISTSVYDAPSIQFSGIANAYCINSANIPLSASPAGGNFTINNIAASVFSPSSLGVGNHKIKYFVSNAAGCSAVDSVSSYVNPVTSASFSGLAASYCDNDMAATLVGSPVGGSFLAAAGLTGTSFNPASVSLGNHSISYVFTNIYGCKDTATHSTSVSASTPVSISLAKSLFCNNESPISISLSLSGGTLSGSGVNNSNQTFNPSSAGLGLKTISYSYSNSNGCTTSASAQVTVNSPVAASFSGLSASYCDNDLPAVLVGLPSGGSFVGPNLFGNIFNPATGSTGMKTIHYIYNNGCIDTATLYTVIYPKPTVNITSNNSFYCASSSPVALTANPAGGVFSGAGITGNNFSPSLAGTGFHPIVYTYTSAQSCSNSDTFTIQVGSSITLDFSAVPNSFCLNNNSISLPAIPSGGVWSGNGIIANAFIGSVAGAGNHWLKYTYSPSSGCSAVDSLLVNVWPLPSVSISGNAMSYCLNSLPDTFLGIPAGGQFVGSGISGSIFYPNLAGLGSKLIQYNYTDSNNCSATAVVSVVVNSLPVADAGNDLLVPCSSQGLIIGSNPQSNYSYFWYPSTGLSNPSIANPLAKPYSTTQYILTVNNLATNCKNTDSVIVSIPAGPQISVSPDTAICLNDYVILAASGAPQYLWSNGSSSSSISVSPSASTTYAVTGIDANGCQSYDSVLVTVNPLPVIQFANDSFNLIGLDSILLYPGNFSSYLWNTGDTSDALMVYLSDVNKSFSVIVTDSNGCSNSESVYIYIQGFNDLFPGINAKVFPNPTADFVHVEFSQPIDLEYWSIYDIHGRLIEYQNFSYKLQNLKIELSKLNPGLYYLNLNSNGKNVIVKIIKNYI